MAPIMNLSRSKLMRSFFSTFSPLVKSSHSIHIRNPFRTKSIHSRFSSLSMPSKPPPSDLPTYSFPTAKDLEIFLENNHTTAPGFYLRLAKKASGIPSVSAAEAVETALCFGWIDGRANALDSNYWTVRYTPRRAKSVWSQKNVATVARLVESGRMRPAGLAAVDAAKADGRWDRAYAGPASMTVPEDFRAKLDGEPGAREFFEGLKKTERYSVLWRVETASPSVRGKRIDALVKMLVEGKLPADKTTSSASLGNRKGKVDAGESGERRKSTRAAAKTQ